MRKQFLLSTVVLGMVLIQFSCKKENLDTEESKTPAYESLIPKIKSWLDEKKSGLQTISVTKIESLETNLHYDQIRLEKYTESKEFIIVPISKEFDSKNNVDKNPVNYLVMVFENQTTITNGNIIQFVSANSEKTVPNNTFSKIFTYQDIECNGLFTVLSLTDHFQYELKFENRKLQSIADIGKKLPRSTGSGRVNECIDWYLQTWYVWSDGSMSMVSEVYAFTSCEGDCELPRTANGRSYSTNCGEGSGGGGGYEIEYEYEYPKNGEFRWTITPIPASFGGGFTHQTNLVGGRFNSRRPEKNRFIFAAQYGSNWQFLGNTYENQGLVSHQNYDGSSSITSDITVDFMAKGKLIFPNQQSYDYLGSRTAQFSQIIWY